MSLPYNKSFLATTVWIEIFILNLVDDTTLKKWGDDVRLKLGSASHSFQKLGNLSEQTFHVFGLWPIFRKIEVFIGS